MKGGGGIKIPYEEEFYFFFVMRVLKHWNKLPREVVDALDTFRVGLDRVLGNLFYLSLCLLISG